MGGYQFSLVSDNSLHVSTLGKTCSTLQDVPELMQLGLAQPSLPFKEQQHHQITNLCLYYETLGHFLCNCLVRLLGKIDSSNLTPAFVPSASSAQISLPLSLQNELASLTLMLAFLSLMHP